MTEIAEYKEWLASGATDAAVIDTLEVSHASWPQVVYLANWDVPVTCTISDRQTPIEQLFEASRFQLEPSATSMGTEQTTSLLISSYGGQIYSYLKAMTPDDRIIPIAVRPRMYLSNDLSKQLINPSPTWTLHSATASHDAVSGDLQIAPLRAHRVGRYYTALEYPILQVTR